MASTAAATATPTAITDNNPCQQVRVSCLAFSASPDCCVQIDRAALKPLAATIRQAASATSKKGGGGGADEHASLVVVWDEEGWHYQLDLIKEHYWGAPVCRERVAAYILALDAINFCFWPSSESNNNNYEYEDLATTLTKAAEADHELQQSLVDQELRGAISPDFAFSANQLQGMTVDKMKALFETHHAQQKVPPNLEERCALWNEVGTILNQKCGGSATALIDAASGSAPALVQLLVEHFPGFQDRSPQAISTTTSTTAGDGDDNGDHTTTTTTLHFYKRAQICVGDWNAALQLRLNHMDQLTTFADYRVPQLLRDCGVLVYRPELAATVDAQQELAKDSVEEHSIRAATVAAVEYLVQELKTEAAAGDDDNNKDNGRKTRSSKGASTSEAAGACQHEWTAVCTDWYLWQVGEKRHAKGELAPHHRVRTIYY